MPKVTELARGRARILRQVLRLWSAEYYITLSSRTFLWSRLREMKQ